VAGGEGSLTGNGPYRGALRDCSAPSPQWLLDSRAFQLEDGVLEIRPPMEFEVGPCGRVLVQEGAGPAYHEVLEVLVDGVAVVEHGADLVVSVVVHGYQAASEQFVATELTVRHHNVGVIALLIVGADGPPFDVGSDQETDGVLPAAVSPGKRLLRRKACSARRMASTRVSICSKFGALMAASY
jgi:hypothetical protein